MTRNSHLNKRPFPLRKGRLANESLVSAVTNSIALCNTKVKFFEV